MTHADDPSSPPSGFEQKPESADPQSPRPPQPPRSPQSPPPPQSPQGVELAEGVYVARAALRFSFSRSSGPGGQAVNKVNTKAELRVAVRIIEGLTFAARQRLRRLAGRRLTQHDELVFQSGTHRSQLDNKRACIERLRDLVAKAARPPTPRKKRRRPTRAMIEKRLASKRRKSQRKSNRRWKAGDE